MKKLKPYLILTVVLMTVTLNAQSEKDIELMNDVEKAKQELLEANSEIKEFFDNSEGYVVFPNVGKGGLIIGGASGNGIVYQNGNAIGAANLKKVNVGLQAGGQAIIEAIFFETKEALNNFKTDDFSFDASISAVVLKSGKALKAKYKNGVAVFALPKAGLMADASVGGQKFDFKPFENSEMK